MAGSHDGDVRCKAGPRGSEADTRDAPGCLLSARDYDHVDGPHDHGRECNHPRDAHDVHEEPWNHRTFFRLVKIGIS